MCVFKQKTAYEMRISDWSSDVCSSDLAKGIVGAEHVLAVRDSGRPALFFSGHYGNWELTCLAAEHFSLPMLHVYRAANNPLTEELQIGSASCRERVCQYW